MFLAGPAAFLKGNSTEITKDSRIDLQIHRDGAKPEGMEELKLPWHTLPVMKRLHPRTQPH